MEINFSTIELKTPANSVITGIITSPNYPGEYPHNLDKTHTIEVESGKILRIQFIHFAVLGKPAACQNYDYVKITDGDGTTLMNRSCGYSLFPPSSSFYFPLPNITTRSNRVEILFHTDGYNQESWLELESGWTLSWSAVTPGLKALIQTVRSFNPCFSSD